MRIGKALFAGNIARCVVSSPVGDLQLIASEKGLRAILWEADMNDSTCAEQVDALNIEEDHQHLKVARKQLEEYFSEQRHDFSIPLDLIGSDFQVSVWQNLSTIPLGVVRSYSAQAESLGRPEAVRAVASANGRNPISIVIPCHRVIAKDSSLGGFAGGLPAKKFLLEFESNR